MLVSPEENFKKNYQIKVKKEIIICAGAFQSPHLLKLSGIGPKSELNAFNISVVADSPGVGQNLYDHFNAPLYVSINESLSLTKEKILNVRQLLNYLINGKGVFANFGVIGFVSEPQCGSHSVGIFGVGAIDEDALRDVSNCKKDVRCVSFHLGQSLILLISGFSFNVSAIL